MVDLKYLKKRHENLISERNDIDALLTWAKMTDDVRAELTAAGNAIDRAIKSVVKVKRLLVAQAAGGEAEG